MNDIGLSKNMDNDEKAFPRKHTPGAAYSEMSFNKAKFKCTMYF